jgi:endonuclease/exonuclease/phosphatase family metal-dependent hydrolase
MPGIKLVSINIERSKHLDTVIPFLKENAPDVVTLQEVMERDVPFFEKELGMQAYFVPAHEFAAYPNKEAPGLEGAALFARELDDRRSIFYVGQGEPLVRFTEDKAESIERIAKMLLSVNVRHAGEEYRIATTHFTWSPQGSITELQRSDLAKLFAALEPLQEFVLTGDFNAPRGRNIWDTIATHYKDNIPAHYTSSIDPMHKAGELPYVVDGLFTTPLYSANDVTLHSGVSDHKAITAIITKLV